MNDRRAALVEKMAEELWQADSIRVTGCRRSVPWSEAGPAAHNQWSPLAAVALDLALEEAAKVADGYEIPMAETSASHIAAAIRALKGKP